MCHDLLIILIFSMRRLNDGNGTHNNVLRNGLHSIGKFTKQEMKRKIHLRLHKKMQASSCSLCK